MVKSGQAEPISAAVLQTLTSELRGYEVSAAEPISTGGKWSRQIAVRKGSWVGVDVDVEQTDPSTVTLSIDRGSKGGTIALLAGLALAVALAIPDPLLKAIGIDFVRTNLTIALAAIAYAFLTVPLAFFVVRLVGRSGAAESMRLEEQIAALLGRLG